MRRVEKALLLLCAVFWRMDSAPAQTSQPAGGDFPIIPYVNKAVGFDIQLPAGWSYDKTGFFGPGGAIGLLIGSAPGNLGTLQALVFNSAGHESFPGWLEFFSKQIATLTGVERVGVQSMTAAGDRPAAYVVVDAKMGADHVRTIYFCVEIDFDQALVLSYSNVAAPISRQEQSSSATSQVEVPENFQKLVSTLRIFRSRQAGEQIAKALERGKAFLARVGLREAAGKLAIDDATRYYLIEVDNAPIGYLSRRFSREARSIDAGKRAGKSNADRDGLRVRDELWRFTPDGSVYFSRHDLFASIDGEMDLIEIHETSIPPAGDATEVLRTRDQCVREASVLVNSYTTNRDQDLPAPRSPLKLDRTYLGLAWVRVAPAMLGEEAHEPIAFTIYDTETRTLIPHVVREVENSPNGERRFELREGFVETPSLLTIDADGHMQRLEAGKLVLRPVKEDEVENRFATQREAAKQRAGGRIP